MAGLWGLVPTWTIGLLYRWCTFSIARYDCFAESEDGRASDSILPERTSEARFKRFFIICTRFDKNRTDNEGNKSWNGSDDARKHRKCSCDKVNCVIRLWKRKGIKQLLNERNVDEKPKLHVCMHEIWIISHTPFHATYLSNTRSFNRKNRSSK